MKLVEIIEALRTNSINKLLNNNAIILDYTLINIYAECSIDIDTDYHFLIAKKEHKKIYKENNITYELLCQLSILDELVREYSEEFPRKTSDILAIDIVDHIENNL